MRCSEDEEQGMDLATQSAASPTMGNGGSVLCVRSADERAAVCNSSGRFK